jgi:hypothetical protein
MRRSLDDVLEHARVKLQLEGVSEPSSAAVRSLARRMVVVGAGHHLGLDMLPGVVRVTVAAGRVAGLGPLEVFADVRVDGLGRDDVLEQVSREADERLAVLVRVRPARWVDRLIAWGLWTRARLVGMRGASDA